MQYLLPKCRPDADTLNGVTTQRLVLRETELFGNKGRSELCGCPRAGHDFWSAFKTDILEAFTA
jgi:hypothetical protein